MEPAVVDFGDAHLSWHNGRPGDDGEQGAWAHEGGELTLTPAPQRDFWSKTFYDPLLVKNNGQALLAEVPADAEATLTTAFTLTPKNQFDQAGAMVWVDDATWCKAGIEWCDGEPKLSCVVTNDGFSDWSTQRWPHFDADRGTTSLRVRVHKVLPGAEQGPALVFEAAPWQPGDGVDAPAEWTFVRIASLRSGAKPWRIGFMSFAPVAAGGSATFHHVRVGPREAAVHDADATAMA